MPRVHKEVGVALRRPDDWEVIRRNGHNSRPHVDVLLGVKVAEVPAAHLYIALHTQPPMQGSTIARYDRAAPQAAQARSEGQRE